MTIERLMTRKALAAHITDIARRKVAAKYPLQAPPLGDQIEALVEVIFEVADRRYGVKAL